MKKVFALLLALLLIVAAFASQRLAVFENFWKDANHLASLCLDALEIGPAGYTYRWAGNGNKGSKYVTDIHSEFPIAAKPELPEKGYRIAVANGEAMPAAHYLQFIEAGIQEYKRGKVALQVLQNRIWAYNVMDVMGFIDPTAVDQVAEFVRARKDFAYRYGLEEVSSNPELLDKLNMAMITKAFDIKHHREDRPFGVVEVQNVRLSEKAITYEHEGATYSLKPHYNGVKVSEIKAMSSGLKKNIQEFKQDYDKYPNEAEFSKPLYSLKDYHFVLRYTGKSVYTMRFVHTNKDGAITNTIACDLAKGPILEAKNKHYAFCFSR